MVPPIDALIDGGKAWIRGNVLGSDDKLGLIR
jgi:hypothetical protein